MPDEYRIDRDKLKLAVRAILSKPSGDVPVNVREQAEAIDSLVYGAEWGGSTPRITEEVLRLCELLRPIAPGPCPPFSCGTCGADGRIIWEDSP